MNAFSKHHAFLCSILCIPYCMRNSLSLVLQDFFFTAKCLIIKGSNVCSILCIPHCIYDSLLCYLVFNTFCVFNFLSKIKESQRQSFVASLSLWTLVVEFTVRSKGVGGASKNLGAKLVRAGPVQYCCQKYRFLK